MPQDNMYVRRRKCLRYDKKKFITKIVTHITKLIIHVTKIVTLVTNFVTNFFCAATKKYLAEREKYQHDIENYLPATRACKALFSAASIMARSPGPLSLMPQRWRMPWIMTRWSSSS